MNQFSSQRDAMEFVAGEVVKEAARANTPLSEVERKMLYFSETDWTLADMPEIADLFHRDYEDTEYEDKIRRLIRSVRSRASKSVQARWSDAIEQLREGDRYFLVMIPPTHAGRGWDLVRLVAVALTVCLSFVSLQLGLSRYVGHDLSNSELGFYGWAAALSVAAIYMLLRAVVGGPAMDRFVNRLVNSVFGTSK